MAKIARVENRADLLKDMTSGALLSIDRKAAQEYREKKVLLNILIFLPTRMI